jgi:branched-chain amino acid transport system ATP-binding protein
LSETLLLVKDLTKRFGGLVALRSVSLEIRRGEVVGIIGPNGAGKTTLVNCVTGVHKPDEGRVYFKGLDITGLPPHRVVKLGIARTWQKIRPFYEMTALEAVVVGALNRAGSIEEAKRLAREALEMVEFPKSKYESPGRSLTLIEHKLVDLARAIATRPELIFIDEIVAGLRPSEIPTIAELVKKINREMGITVAVIEHVVRFVKQVSQRVIAMHEGTVIAEGTPEEVLNHPLVVEAYLGARLG